WRGRLAVTRATRLIDDGDYTAAIRTLLGAVAATPRDARVHYYLGLAYARLGVPRGALNQLSDAVRLAPGDAWVHDALGQARRAGLPDRHSTKGASHDTLDLRSHRAGACCRAGGRDSPVRFHEARGGALDRPPGDGRDLGARRLPLGRAGAGPQARRGQHQHQARGRGQPVLRPVLR